MISLIFLLIGFYGGFAIETNLELTSDSKPSRMKRLIFGVEVATEDQLIFPATQYQSTIINAHYCNENLMIALRNFLLFHPGHYDPIINWKIKSDHVKNMIVTSCPIDRTRAVCGGMAITEYAVQTTCHCIARLDTKPHEHMFGTPRPYNAWEDMLFMYVGALKFDPENTPYISKDFLIHELCMQVANVSVSHNFGVIVLRYRLASKTIISAPALMIQMAKMWYYTVEKQDSVEATSQPRLHLYSSKKSNLHGLPGAYLPSIDRENLYLLSRIDPRFPLLLSSLACTEFHHYDPNCKPDTLRIQLIRVYVHSAVCLVLGWGAENLHGYVIGLPSFILRRTWQVVRSFNSCWKLHRNVEGFFQTIRRERSTYKTVQTWSCLTDFGKTVSRLTPTDSGSPLTCVADWSFAISNYALSVLREGGNTSFFLTTSTDLVYAFYENSWEYRRQFTDFILDINMFKFIAPTFRPYERGGRAFDRLATPEPEVFLPSQCGGLQPLSAFVLSATTLNSIITIYIFS